MRRECQRVDITERDKVLRWERTHNYYVGTTTALQDHVFYTHGQLLRNNGGDFKNRTLLPRSRGQKKLGSSSILSMSNLSHLHTPIHAELEQARMTFAAEGTGRAVGGDREFVPPELYGGYIFYKFHEGQTTN